MVNDAFYSILFGRTLVFMYALQLREGISKVLSRG